MKELILRIKEIKRAGFITSGYIIVNPVAKNDGKETDLGDFVISSPTDSTRYTLRRLRDRYKNAGYTLRGDWDF